MRRAKSEAPATSHSELLVAERASDTEKLERFIESVGHLPPAPKSIVELLPLFNQPDRDVDRIVKLLCHDPAFTAEILRICNSAFFSGAMPCTDMFEMVMRLGLFEVFRIVIAISSSHTISESNAAAGLNVQKMWRHSVVSAVAASVIAAEARRSESVAFTAGILHDVGKLVFASAAGSEYSQLLITAERSRRELVELEREMFGFDHAVLGSHLLARWNLPPEVSGAVRFHHALSDGGEYQELAAILHLANIFSHSLDDLFADPKTVLAGGTESSWMLHLPPKSLPFLLAATKEGLDHVKDILAI